MLQYKSRYGALFSHTNPALSTLYLYSLSPMAGLVVNSATLQSSSRLFTKRPLTANSSDVAA